MKILDRIFDESKGRNGRVPQRIENIENRFVSKRLSLIEQYLEGILWVAVKYRATGAIVEDFTALALIHHEGNPPNPAACFRPGGVSEFEILNLHGRNGGNENKVFVRDVEPVEAIQSEIPAFVGLYFVKDDVDDLLAWRNSFAHMSFDGTFKRLPIFSKGELPVLAPHRTVGVGSDVVSVVEGGPEVVQCIAKDGWDMLVKRFEFGRPSLFQRAVLALGPQSLHVITDVVPEAGFKITDVMFGPFDF